MSETKTMKELHAIREQLGIERQNLTMDERLARSKNAAQRLKEEFGIVVVEGMIARHAETV